MSVFKNIFNKPAKDESVADVEALIASINAEEADARKQIAAIDARRNELLVAGDDAKLDADQVAREKASRTIERAAIARPDLDQRLAAAKGRARQKLLAEMTIERDEIVADLLAAFERAVDLNEAAQTFTEKARAAFGGEPTNHLNEAIAFPLLQRHVVEPWKLYLRQMTGPVQRPATAPAAKPAPAPAPVQKKPAPAKPFAATVKRRSPEAATAAAGTTRVQMLRSNIPLPDGGLSQTGDVVDLPADTAHALLMAGAADLAATVTSAAPEPKEAAE